MTACNLFVGHSHAILLTDRALLDRCSDRIVAIVPKVAADSRLRIAVAYEGIGNGNFSFEMTQWLADQPDQAAAMRAMPKRLRAFFDAVPGDVGADHPYGRGITMAIALHSHQPEGYIVTTTARPDLPGMVPYRLQGVRRYVSPIVDDAPDRHLDPRLGGLALLERQRAIKPQLIGHHVVGGEADLVIVDHDGARHEMLRTWPDKVGEPILPPWRARKWSSLF